MNRLIQSSLAALVASGCAGSETGNGARDEVPVKVELKLVAGAGGGYVAPDRSGAIFELEGASALVDRIDFVLPDGAGCDEDGDDDDPSVAPYEAFCDGGSGRVRVDGPWVVDLVTGMTEPPIDALLLPVGPIERVEIRLKPGSNGDWTLAAEGLFGDRDFRLELRLGDVVRFEGDRAAAIVDTTMIVGLGFDPSTWFAGLDLAACIATGDVPTVDGVLRLDQGSPSDCGNVESEVVKAMRVATRLAVDR